MKVELTKEQWASFGRGVMDDPEKSALQSCCGNISALRDAILAIEANGGEVTRDLRKPLAQAWGWCCDGHEFGDRFPTLRLVVEQAGLKWPK